MCFEAKNHYFKEMAHIVGNYKNIAKMLSFWHQRLSCYYMQKNYNLEAVTEYGKGIPDLFTIFSSFL